MRLAKRATDRMQRLPGLPPLPYIRFLRGRKPRPFPLGHNTILKQQIFLDGVASTYRIHRPYRTSGGLVPIPDFLLRYRPPNYS